jgi:alginate O-acetyltransferase complex protein AlgI
MMFDTLQFWLFFAATMVLLALLRDRPAKVALVAASYVFYGFWDARFCLLLAGSTAVNYAFGRLIDAREGKARKRMVAFALIFNLALLAFFKYTNFFIDSFAATFGVDPTGLALNIILPVGISFFTFEGIAYAVDVYRRQLRAVRDPVDFSLFIAFFPHLVAGPIIRPTDFFPQLAQRPPLTSEDSRWGMREILKGLIKKVAFANYFAPIADAWFGGGQYHGMAVPAWVGVFAFSLQIYFDFSGYTDIARGCARLLGYRFPPNFERPYLSANITEFWRRWHISLSFWLRDYLYISLGGNRVSMPRTYVNLLIVMGLGGLWHGASWNFAIWGLYHGFLLIGHRLWRQAIERSGAARIVDVPLAYAAVDRVDLRDRDAGLGAVPRPDAGRHAAHLHGPRDVAGPHLRGRALRRVADSVRHARLLRRRPQAPRAGLADAARAAAGGRAGRGRDAVVPAGVRADRCAGAVRLLPILTRHSTDAAETAVRITQASNIGSLHPAQGALDGDPTIGAPVSTGTATFDFGPFEDDVRASVPDVDGRCFTGLPVWTMAVSAYGNDNAQAGRIATFPVEEVASRVTNIIDCSAE